MSDLTPELNLALCVDDDDTADYLTLDSKLRGSLKTLDGLFSTTVGHTHNGAHQGGPINAITPGAIPDGSVTAAKLAPGTLDPEALFAGTWTVQNANYAVAVRILWVFCTAAITITLPAAATSNRPITVVAVTGNTTVAAAAGGVIGGSINTGTGAVMNGTVSAGDSITYKSDGTDWRAV